MNKIDLIARLVEETGGIKIQSETYLNVALSQIGKALASGESMILPGFGTFEVRERASCTGRNP